MCEPSKKANSLSLRVREGMLMQKCPSCLVCAASTIISVCSSLYQYRIALLLKARTHPQCFQCRAKKPSFPFAHCFNVPQAGCWDTCLSGARGRCHRIEWSYTAFVLIFLSSLFVFHVITLKKIKWPKNWSCPGFFALLYNGRWCHMQRTFGCEQKWTEVSCKHRQKASLRFRDQRIFMPHTTVRVPCKIFVIPALICCQISVK